MVSYVYFCLSEASELSPSSFSIRLWWKAKQLLDWWCLLSFDFNSVRVQKLPLKVFTFSLRQASPLRLTKQLCAPAHSDLHDLMILGLFLYYV